MDAILASIFDRFLIEFPSQLRHLRTPKLLIFHWFFKAFLKNRLLKLISIFGPIWMPTWLRFASQNPPKCIQKSILRNIKILIDVGIDFGSIFDANLAPTWPQLEAQDGPKSEKMASKNFRGAPRRGFGRRSFILMLF